MTRSMKAAMQNASLVTAHVAFAMLSVTLLAGCGRSGFPVAPDDYGIGLRMQQERQKEEQARKEQEVREAAARKQEAEAGPVTPTEELMLPDLRPLTGR